jgi:hypothetical protein
MGLKHNKKRNVGMLSEFFAQYIAKSVVSRKYNKVASAKQVWNSHVKKGSELQKEMQLFSALHERKFSSEKVAHDLLKQVKTAATSLKTERLNKEKTSLLREVQSKFGDDSFFTAQVTDYTDLASIQILLNHCSSVGLKEGVINPAITEIEDRVLKHMLKTKEQETPQKDLNELLSLKESEVDGLVINVMKEKMNKKFLPQLTDDQKTIVQQFVFENSHTALKKTLKGLRDETLGLISEELKGRASKVDKEKLTKIQSLLKEDYNDVEDINDTTVTFYMTVSKLNDELKDEK